MKENLLSQTWNWIIRAGDALVEVGLSIGKVKENFQLLAKAAAPIAVDFGNLRNIMVKIMEDLRALWDVVF